MTQYKIIVEETVVGEFDIQADSKEEALKIAEENYKNGKFIVCPGEVQKKKMAVVEVEEEKDFLNWKEF